VREDWQWFPIAIARPRTEYDALFRTNPGGDVRWDGMQVCGGGDDVFALLVRGCALCQGTSMYVRTT